MNKKLTIITLVAMMAASILGISGCKEKTEEATTDTVKTTDKTTDKTTNITTDNLIGNAAEATDNAFGNAAKATGNAIGNVTEVTGNFLAQKKGEAIEATQEKITLLDKKWQELQAKATPATDEAKAELQKATDMMVKTLAEAKTKLVEAKDASVDTWQKDVLPTLTSAMDKAQKLYDDTAAKFDSK